MAIEKCGIWKVTEHDEDMYRYHVHREGSQMVAFRFCTWDSATRRADEMNHEEAALREKRLAAEQEQGR